MEIQTIDASLLAKMFLSGAKNLEAKKEWINELNVFPVPDGDTGTNMCMTIMSAANAVAELENADMKTVAKAISSGSLRGARGNSGVILSQLFRGLTKVMGAHDEVTVEILSEAFEKAVQTAYKAVMQPKEGTILTVARGAADKAVEMAGKTDDIVEFAEAVIAEAEAVLAKTPDMLPVLKQAGVVDSGGQGLVCVLQGAYDALVGKEVDYTAFAAEAPAKAAEKTKTTVEFVIESDKPLASYQLKELKAKIEALSLGDIVDLKIGDETSSSSKKEDAPAKAEPAEPAKEMGFVSIATGDGLTSIFTELGCDYMIPGGQTMNPSTDDILSAVEKVNAKTVFVLPNNKNIILAANQAAAICEEKKVVVIPTKTIPQGITALISFDPDASVEDNESNMTEEIKNVKTGQVTYAVRDTVIDDKEITKGDWMGMADTGLLSVNADISVAFKEMIDQMVTEDSAVVSIYWGEGSDQEKAEALGKAVEEKYPDLEIEISEGGQAVYAYIVSVE
ncbi:DAK2 domain-containing protein [Pseudobutyrivibrio xylanivorans]|uniref:DAK2 domain-containing protein n=1 Tax=Pseudobutyrivibrio xylanivorans TaxID=185007 RepID=A0A5P6VTL6_PSEXY|nr:DAK2 domain-containing protein [Pseudobutyrivibrio xylanivorans]QFJ55648.1 DAK2 domain-containing protein [Pseudobutyrivibrio xylanivorans]